MVDKNPPTVLHAPASPIPHPCTHTWDEVVTFLSFFCDNFWGKVSGNSTIYITKCANTGAVTGEVQKAECVQSIYVSEKVIESGAADAVVCDQATKDASKDAKVTATIFTK